MQTKLKLDIMQFGDARSTTNMLKDLKSFGLTESTTTSKQLSSEGVIEFEEAQLKDTHVEGKAILITQVGPDKDKVLLYGIL